MDDLVQLWVKRGSEPERHVTDYSLSPARGHGYVAYRNLGDRVMGDWNGDTLVALADHPSLVKCMKGAGVAASPHCQAVFDFDADTDVDLADLAQMEQAYTR